MAYEYKRSLPPELAQAAREITAHAKAAGLDFWEICFELLDNDELNEVAAYGGFPTRFPHWKFGMEFEQLHTGYTWGLSKIYELVINNDPCYAYLMKSNSMVDQKLVMAHVCGHADFFKNNLWFAHTNRKMVDQMANHGTRIRRYAERHGHDTVERFVDACLSLENLIDVHSPYIKRPTTQREETEDDPRSEHAPRKLRSKNYMDRFINPPEFLDEQRRRHEEAVARSKHFPEHPQRDVLRFLLDHAPLERWQRDVLGIVREEAYYYAPQAMTKVLNEGWACLAASERVFTNSGLIRMEELVAGAEADVVFDGAEPQRVYDRHVIHDQETVEVRTRRGLRLRGSVTHRVRLSDGRWKRLDQLALGDVVEVSAGGGLWAEDLVALDWKQPVRVTLEDVATRAGVSVSTVCRYRRGRRISERSRLALKPHLDSYEAADNMELPQSINARQSVRLPRLLDERLASFLGYMVGDGHISRVKRTLGLTTADEEQAESYGQLCEELFDIKPRTLWDEGRWRVRFSSETVADFLTQLLGLTEGPSARSKRIPELVLRSPEPVVRAFLRAYFDSDGYAGKQGVILSTASDDLAEQTQLVLLNYGILSRRRLQASDGVWHVHVMGASAARFEAKVGFGLHRKRLALRRYVEDHLWFKIERWEDEVVSLLRGREDVFDVSVTDSHRYVAQGFVNHNSFWHSKLMTSKILSDAEVVDYADRHAGTMATQPGQLNPYKLGIELLRDIEDRWNTGKFGAEWEQCDDAAARARWDKQLGRGLEKVFEVRRIYNDVMFIDEFLTEEFCREQKLFTFEYSKQAGDYVIASREFQQVKRKLLDQLTNWGNPQIVVADGNYENRGELLLRHLHPVQELRQDHARDTLEHLFTLWNRPVHLETVVEQRTQVLSFDGRKHSERVV